MSLKENDVFVEMMADQIVVAMEKKDYEQVKSLVERLRDNGFEKESVEIWDRLLKEQREAYLKWYDNLEKEHTITK